MVLLTGNESLGFREFRWYMNLKAAMASRLRPLDMRNFGLSGKKKKSTKLRKLGTAVMATKTCQEVTEIGGI